MVIVVGVGHKKTEVKVHTKCLIKSLTLRVIYFATTMAKSVIPRDKLAQRTLTSRSRLFLFPTNYLATEVLLTIQVFNYGLTKDNPLSISVGNWSERLINLESKVRFLTFLWNFSRTLDLEYDLPIFFNNNSI